MIISVTPDLALDEGYTYAGGLGVLEGDKFYGAAALNLPYHVLTFLYPEGYVEYDFDSEGRPIPKPQRQPPEFLEKLAYEDTLTIRTNGEDCKVEIRKYARGRAQAVFFNPLEDAGTKLANRIYVWASSEEKFRTYALLARASSEYVKAHVGVRNVDYIDLQEAYACILPLILRIPGKYRFVIHTAGPWGHPFFGREHFERELGYRFINRDVSLTEVGLASSREVFTVSANHFDIMSKVIPHFSEKLRYVTNGVNLQRWMDHELKADYESGNLNLDRFMEAKRRIRARFLDFIRGYKDVDVGDRMIAAWCRRLAPYKRPEFVIKAVEQLPREKFFFVLGGKAHPQDGAGLEYMRLFRKLHLERENVVYVPNYNVSIAKTILKSADLLLFTPFSGWEACGTSYMKSAINGVPSVASRDGGAIELITDNVNGWFFGEHLTGLEELWGEVAEQVNALDYEDFKKRLMTVESLHAGNLERFHQTAVNALTAFAPRTNIERVLREYYPDMIKTYSA